MAEFKYKYLYVDETGGGERACEHVHACVRACARARKSSNRVCTSKTLQGCKFKPQSWQVMA